MKSHCFEKLYYKEIESLSSQYSIHVSNEISLEETKILKHNKIISKIIVFLKEYHFDLVFYLPDQYPFKPPILLLRKDKLPFHPTILHEKLLDHISDYVGEERYEYFSIQTFVMDKKELLCKNENDKNFLLEWKYQFDKESINHYAPSIHLNSYIIFISELLKWIDQKEKRNGLFC